MKKITIVLSVLVLISEIKTIYKENE